MDFPDDDNGDVLRRMQSRGDTLDYLRDIDFTVVFPDQSSAEGFVQNFLGLGYRLSVDQAETAAGLPWDVLVTRHMVPSHAEIGAFEDTLQDIAENYGGRNDGWGCMSGSRPSE